VAVKIRLKRMGKIRAPYYRIVVADSRTKRDGRVIEEIGKYHPTENPSLIEVASDRAQYWLGVGAQPTEQVRALLKLTGDWGTHKGEKDVENRVQQPEGRTAFQADAAKKPVLQPKSTPADNAAVLATEAQENLETTLADEAADAERAEEIDASSTVSHESPAQADNS
jgi:small subunit ribosomal protein S16